MNSCLRFGPCLLVAVALTATGLGLAESRRPRIPPTEWLQVDCETKSFGLAPERTVLQVEFTFRNVGNRPLHILGSAGSCTRQGCVRALPNSYEIVPGTSRKLLVDVLAGREGSMTNVLLLYTDCQGKERLPLTITGTVYKIEAGPTADPAVL